MTKVTDFDGHSIRREYNALNQLITELREGANPVNKSFAYDKRGNLTRIMENGQMTQQYVYGALNRLEEAVNGAGKAAKYQYNGLGHRVGKLEGTLSKGKREGLNPRNGIKAETEIGNWNQIRYTIDLTREYHNLLVKEEGERTCMGIRERCIRLGIRGIREIRWLGLTMLRRGSMCQEMEDFMGRM